MVNENTKWLIIIENITKFFPYMYHYKEKFHGATLNNTNQDMQSHFVSQLNTPNNVCWGSNLRLTVVINPCETHFTPSHTFVHPLCGCDESQFRAWIFVIFLNDNFRALRKFCNDSKCKKQYKYLKSNVMGHYFQHSL